MKTHLNTLYVTTQGAYVAKQGETVQVRVERKVRAQFPLHTLEGIVCFGRVGCSPIARRLRGEGSRGLLFTESRPLSRLRRRILPRQRARAPQAVPPGRRARDRTGSRPPHRPGEGRQLADRLAPRRPRRGRRLRAQRDPRTQRKAARRLGSRTARGRRRSMPSAGWRARPPAVISAPSTRC